jgi:hypothetical protein
MSEIFTRSRISKFFLKKIVKMKNSKSVMKNFISSFSVKGTFHGLITFTSHYFPLRF